MKITRKEVARLAGVSTATVSYVLNGSNRVSEETRNRVKQIIKEYNYRPDLVARAMATRSTMQIAFLINDISNNFFAEIVTEFERAAASEGYSVNICTSDTNISSYIDGFVARRMDGVFCMLSPTRVEPERLYALRQENIPVLISGNPAADREKVALIEPDYMQGMELALGCLKGYGHRKIAFLGAFPEDFSGDIRLKAFRAHYEKMFPQDLPVVITGDYPYHSTIESGYALTKRLLASKKAFTAVLTTNDSMAIGCIEALREAGLRVPEDVSVMGFDNIAIGRHVTVPLTTVGFDKKHFAATAFDMLHTAIAGGELREAKEKMYLTERKSVAECSEKRS